MHEKTREMGMERQGGGEEPEACGERRGSGEREVFIGESRGCQGFLDLADRK